jgi:hypothetical protein
MEMDKYHECRNAGMPIKSLVQHRWSSVSF